MGPRLKMKYMAHACGHVPARGDSASREMGCQSCAGTTGFEIGTIYIGRRREQTQYHGGNERHRAQGSKVIPARPTIQ